MIYRKFGRMGWGVSAVGMGTWNIGNQWGLIDEGTALAAVQGALDGGINLFDTAESYGIPSGLSEERLGRALAGRRHQVYIASKIGHWGRRTGQMVPITTVDMVRLCTHAILYRLRTDWVDVLLCHQGDIEDPSVFLEGFEALKREGKVRAYGISTNDFEALKRFNAGGACAVVETDYSLLNREAEREILPYCQKNGIAVLARGPLRKGLLSGKYPPGVVFEDSVRARWHKDAKKQADMEKKLGQVERLKKVLKPGEEMVSVAIRYVLSHPAAPAAIPGAKSAEQAAANARAGGELLDEPEKRRILQALGDGQ